MHFLGIKWDNEKKKPFFAYRNIPGEKKINYLLLNPKESITVSIQEDRFCIGSSASLNDGSSLCKNPIDATDRYSQCNLCRTKDSTHFMHLDGLNYNQLEKLKLQSSVNYVNIFGNKIIKTGVTAKKRKFARVLEQGAIATIFFTDTDGYTSRIIENLVSKALDIKQSVTWGTKMQYLQNVITSEEAQKELKIIFDKINETLSDKYRTVVLERPEFYFNYDNYFIDFPKEVEKVYMFDRFCFGDVISGKIIGTYGEIILLEQNDTVIAGINTKDLQGFILKISKEKVDTSIKAKPKLVTFYKKPPENLTLF